MSLRKKAPRALITRPEGRSERLMKLLQSKNIDAVHEPFIETEYLTQSPELQERIRMLFDGEYDWVGLTSRTAVEAVVACAQEIGIPYESLPDNTRCASVGSGTTETARETGWTVDVMPPGPEYSAQALLDVWPAAQGETRVLLPRSNQANDLLSIGLKEKGYLVDAVDAYATRSRTVSPQIVREIVDGEFDVLVLASPSAVHSLQDALKGKGSVPSVTTVVTIGRPTALACEAVGLTAMIAPKAKAESIATIVEQLVDGGEQE